MAALQWLHGQDSTALHRAGQHSNDTDYNPEPKRNLILALMLTLVYLGGCDMAVVWMYVAWPCYVYRICIAMMYMAVTWMVWL